MLVLIFATERTKPNGMRIVHCNVISRRREESRFGGPTRLVRERERATAVRQLVQMQTAVSSQSSSRAVVFKLSVLLKCMGHGTGVCSVTAYVE